MNREFVGPIGPCSPERWRGYDALGVLFGGRHELYERNYAGNYEMIRLENLPTAIATGDLDKIRRFVDSFMAEYDLDGWVADDLVGNADVRK
ncbi:MAG TPA: hypothetical protein VMT61_03575 [Candidatus Binataceae bacterium]|nr:hypothetical protein [Candidatus Binataceae bacterium]